MLGDLVRGRADPARSPRPRSAAVRRPSAAPVPRRRAAGRPCPARRPDRPAAPTDRRSAGCRSRGRRESPSPGKRYCSTSAQVRPDSSSPHRAARAIRRSPGGRQFSSSRQPTGRPAVVGHGDDRGQPVGDPTQRAERGATVRGRRRTPPRPAAGRSPADGRTRRASRRSSLTGPCHGRSLSGVQERFRATRLSVGPNHDERARFASPGPRSAERDRWHAHRLTPAPRRGAGPWSPSPPPAVGGRTPRPSRCCGACRRCSRSRRWRTACPR